MTDRFRLAFECEIDAATLWDIAAERAAVDFALSLDAVIDTIGPREDPEIHACVLILLEPIARRSDLSDAISITPLPAADTVVPGPDDRPARSPARRAADRRWMGAPNAA